MRTLLVPRGTLRLSSVPHQRGKRCRRYCLEWIIPIENRNLEGALERTGQAVVLDGDVSDCANFSLWLRSLISEKYPLFFYDEGYSADIELRQDTTQEQIVELFAKELIQYS